jgi:cation diffusion facilitator family transporter
VAPSAPPSNAIGRPSLRRFAWLSIAAALTTIALKSVAYLATGSVGLLSDALESLVNLVAAIVALIVLHIAESPPDDEHEWGHEKVEYFASAFEGAAILAAAVAIMFTAVPRLLDPRPLEAVGFGLIVSCAASLVNLVVARILLATGKRHRSITLEADGHHLMTDVWTSVGVVAGVGLVAITELPVLDAVVAILVALNIVWTGGKLLVRSAMGLLDASVSKEERAAIEAVLHGFAAEGIEWHALRTRQSGSRRFITVHILVPGKWNVKKGHDLCERVERELRATGPKTTVMTHLEPIEDDISQHDKGLDRDSDPPPEDRGAIGP